jgi:pheromone alpha factor receptor
MSASTSAIPSPDPNSPEWSLYLDNQTFNVTGLDGSPTTLTFSGINAETYLVGVEAACAGFAIGFASMLFIVLLLLAQSKVRKPIFCLNLASLLLVTIREILVISILCQPTVGVGEFFLGAMAQYSNTIWSADVLSIILGAILYTTIMTSLVLQVRVVFAAEPRTRMIFTIVGGIAVLLESGFVQAWAIFDIIAIFHRSTVRPFWVYTTIRIFFCGFVGVACLIFLYKLGLTIYRRRKMGMNIKKFGPLQIIFVMFCQCLVVPVIFYVLDLTVTDTSFDNFEDLGQVFLVCTLPLSALWASADARDPGPVKQTHGSDGSSSGPHSRKEGFWSHKPRGDDFSDLEEGTHTNETVQLHPTSFNSTLEDSKH